jgi:predicted nuclease of restriction endonuclease-like (RecB) superfamily
MADDLAPNPQSARLLDDVRALLRAARTLAFAAANAAMVDAYWQIGRRIVEEEQGGEVRAEYGSQLIRNLARSLGDEFGRGVSVANLWNFRQFYLTFPDAGKLYALRRELTWTHWRLVMRIETEAARDYYIRECAEQAWSSRRLEREIATRAFDRLLVRPPAPAAPVPTDTQRALTATEFVKDPYVLEFLGLSEPFDAHERELETLLVSRLRDFLMELGKGFSFVDRQFRISTETAHFYVDLVFYNYLLKCFVLIDLKTSKLAHADIGQMDMYVRMFDDLKRGPDDNPTLGIILCADKDETLVRYSVLKESQQLFASKYRLILPSEEELRAELERRHVFELPERDGADE